MPDAAVTQVQVSGYLIECEFVILNESNHIPLLLQRQLAIKSWALHSEGKLSDLISV